MNNTKHTPGPWKLRADYAVTAHCDETETHEPIARAYGDGNIENLYANSRLIAAAPDLLAALELVYSNAGESPEWIRSKIIAAIEKATGGAK